jgi:HlyD family secretion protein
MKRFLTVLLIIAAVGVGAGGYYIRHGAGEVQVNTAPITRGDIIDAVGSTGSLQAVTTVQVGSQVSGNISWLGADFNSIVHKGQVIAKLDPSLFEAQLEQSKANLNQARANLSKAQSDLDRMKVQLLDAQQKYTRARELAAKQIEAQSDLDAAKIAVDSADASLKSQEATLKQADAAITQAEASVNQNQVNLDHTVIEAPIDGIVIQRSVDVGQTVAASMQAPTLFIIAADLTKMQVNANIDEADVGRIRPGQTVTFRVDAYPGEEFQGTVSQIRLQPVVVNNVTTYGTMIDVPNTDLKLKPGMTANLKVQIAKASGVLRVANAALRFRPSSDIFVALNQAVPPELQGGAGPGGRSGGVVAGGAGGGVGSAVGVQLQGPRGDGGPASASAEQGVALSAVGRNGRADGARSGGGERSADFSQNPRALDRFKAMSSDQKKEFVDRLKARGADTKAFETLMATGKPKNRTTVASKYGSVAGETIDALFSPLPPVESTGRAWLYVDRQLKPLRLRLGITDGTYTQLLSNEVEPNTELVTGVILPGQTRTAVGPGAGNPLLPQQGRGPGGFGGGGRGR